MALNSKDEEAIPLLRSTSDNEGRQKKTSAFFHKQHSTASQPSANFGPNHAFTMASAGYGGISLSRKRSLQELRPVGISWHGISLVHGRTGKRILDNVSGMAESGQLVALMGSSGAGKTSLLNALLSRNLQGLRVEGSVLVDGRELGPSITYISGYVQQDELFMSTLTVREHLEIQGALRLANFSKAEISSRVDEVIRELGLAHCQDLRIGQKAGGRKGISGGEARRLLFASELLNNPAILFCDEPTTGLDSSMATKVVNVLSRLAKSGRTVLCTIHQPSSMIYRKFDRVIFLADGKLAYFGEPANAVEMFSRFGYSCPANYNPADMIIEKLSIEPYREAGCRETIARLCTSFQQSSEAALLYEQLEECRKRQGKYPERPKMANFGVQLKCLLKRSVLDNWRNSALTKAKLSQKSIMGVFVGLLYWQTPLDIIGINNINGAIFYLVSELTYSTLFGILTFLPNDFPLVVREYHDGLYYVASYYVARSLSYVPLFALDGAIMVSFAYWMAGLLPTVSGYLTALGTSILVEQSAAAFGVMLSSASPSFPVAVSVAGPLLTLLSLTGGLYANVGELPGWITWISTISWFKYGFEALSINQWEGSASEGVCLGATREENGTVLCRSPESILHAFSFDASHFLLDLFSMFGFLMLFYLIGLVGLWVRVKRGRLAKLSWNALLALGRAFRGKKANPLRKRIDSVELDVREIFMVTLCFTVLMFLLPTVLAYFAVFSLLWSAVNLFCILSYACGRSLLAYLFDIS